MICENKGILDSLLPSVDSILGIRDSIGAVIRPVFFLTRTWYQDSDHTSQSSDISGYAKDVVVQMLPSPKVVDITQEIRTREGGSVNNGDVMLNSVSRSKYRFEELDGSSSANNIEQLYVVGVKVYQVVKVTEQYLTWRIILKELTNQTRY